MWVGGCGLLDGLHSCCVAGVDCCFVVVFVGVAFFLKSLPWGGRVLAAVTVTVA